MLTAAADSRPVTCRAERGQVMFIFLVVMTVILVVGIIVVDVGLWLSERRQAQSAADLAALAAATELRTSNAAATAKGQEFARRNGFDNTSGSVNVQVNPGWNGNPDLVEVIIEEQSPALFGEIFGLANMDIGARAVASVQDGAPIPEYAIFANRSNNCNGLGSAPLDLDASNMRISGSVHANNSIHVGGDNNVFEDRVTWVCSGGLNVSGSGNVFSGGTQRVSSLPPPIDYSYSQFPCTVILSGPNTDLASVSSLWSTPNQLKDNVICSSGGLILSRDDVRGRVTLVSQRQVEVSGDDVDLTALWNNVVLYSSRSSGPDAIDLVGENGRFSGFVHAPNGRVDIEESNNVIIGSVIADRVTMTGNRHVIDASGVGQLPAPPTIWLVE